MKTVKLNFSEIENTLTREEMKNIMAGSGGNIYCEIGSDQECTLYSTLEACTDWCIFMAGRLGTSCGGCWQFPPL